nr:uncharacterized mitochondrial protein AtMg00810-like [Tanacetum cinerariifolium]
MEKCDTVGTPMATKPKLDADLSGKLVDQNDYRSKIESLMYLTSSRPDIVQAVCYFARYQARPTEKHLKEVKRMFRYLRGTINMGLWYLKDSSFELTAFSNANYAECIDTRKSTSGFLGDKLVSWMSKKQDCTAMSSVEAEGGLCCTLDGFIDPDNLEKVYRLRKALYGLEQAPRACRPDIVQAVCYFARYQARPTEKHRKEVKRIFRYLRGTINMGLWYLKDSGFELTAFSNANYAECIDTRKSTSGFLGDKLVSWMSKKQDCTAMSSVEAEYVVLSVGCAQVMWMRT